MAVTGFVYGSECSQAVSQMIIADTWHVDTQSGRV